MVVLILYMLMACASSLFTYAERPTYDFGDVSAVSNPTDFRGMASLLEALRKGKLNSGAGNYLSFYDYEHKKSSYGKSVEAVASIVDKACKVGNANRDIDVPAMADTEENHYILASRRFVYFLEQNKKREKKLTHALKEKDAALVVAAVSRNNCFSCLFN